MKSGDNRGSYHHREEKRKQEEKKKIEIIDVVIKRKMKNVAKYESVKVKESYHVKTASLKNRTIFYCCRKDCQKIFVSINELKGHLQSHEPLRKSESALRRKALSKQPSNKK